MQLITRPYNEDAPSWCPYFFDLVKEDDLLKALHNNKNRVLELINSIPFSKEEHRYDPSK